MISTVPSEGHREPLKPRQVWGNGHTFLLILPGGRGGGGESAALSSALLRCLPAPDPLSPPSLRRCPGLWHPSPLHTHTASSGESEDSILLERTQRPAPRSGAQGPARGPGRRRGEPSVLRRPPAPFLRPGGTKPPQPAPRVLSLRLNRNVASKSWFGERQPIRSPAKPRFSPPASPRSCLETLELEESLQSGVR